MLTPDARLPITPYVKNSPLTEYARDRLIRPEKELMPFVKIILEFGGGWKIVECGSTFYVAKGEDIDPDGYRTIESALERMKEIAPVSDFTKDFAFDDDEYLRAWPADKNTKTPTTQAGYGEW